MRELRASKNSLFPRREKGMSFVTRISTRTLLKCCEQYTILYSYVIATRGEDTRRSRRLGVSKYPLFIGEISYWLNSIVFELCESSWGCNQSCYAKNLKEFTSLFTLAKLAWYKLGSFLFIPLFLLTRI